MIDNNNRLIRRKNRQNKIPRQRAAIHNHHNHHYTDTQMQPDIDDVYVLCGSDDEEVCLDLGRTTALLESCAVPMPSGWAPAPEAPKRDREEPVHVHEEDEKDAYASVQTDSGDKTTKSKKKARPVQSGEEDEDDGEASSGKVEARFFSSSLFSSPFSTFFLKKGSSKNDVLLARFGQGADLKRSKGGVSHRRLTSGLYYDHDILNIPVVMADSQGNETLRAPGVGYRFHPVKDANTKAAAARTHKARVEHFMRSHTDDEGNLTFHGKPTDYINRNNANTANPRPTKGQFDPYEVFVSDSGGADVLIPPQVVLHQVQKLTRMVDTIMHRVVPALDKLRLASDPSQRSLYEELCMDLHMDDLRHAQIPFLRKHDPENPTPQDVPEYAWNQCYYVTELEKKIAADAETERKKKMDATLADIEMTRTASSSSYGININQFLDDVDFNDLGKLSDAAMPNELMSFPPL